jgi:hypothetical protein
MQPTITDITFGRQDRPVYPVDSAWQVWDTTPAGEVRDRLRDAIWRLEDAVDNRGAHEAAWAALVEAQISAQAVAA